MGRSGQSVCYKHLLLGSLLEYVLRLASFSFQVHRADDFRTLLLLRPKASFRNIVAQYRGHLLRIEARFCSILHGEHVEVILVDGSDSGLRAENISRGQRLIAKRWHRQYIRDGLLLHFDPHLLANGFGYFYDALTWFEAPENCVGLACSVALVVHVFGDLTGDVRSKLFLQAQLLLHRFELSEEVRVGVSLLSFELHKRESIWQGHAFSIHQVSNHHCWPPAHSSIRGHQDPAFARLMNVRLARDRVERQSILHELKGTGQVQEEVRPVVVLQLYAQVL